MSILTFRGALGAAALAVSCQAALAHAVLERPEAEAGSAYRAVVQVMHGCKGSPTTAVKITLPEGVISARPMPKPGWTAIAQRGPYARSYSFGQSKVSEGVREVTWSGGRLADDQFDEFVLSVRLTDAFKPGETIYFPVEQTCESGRRLWVQVPGGATFADGGPAPGVRIVQAAATQAGAASPATSRVGALTIEQPWMRATPGGAKVAGGYLRITNTGSEPDRLVGTSIPSAGRGEVHEMLSESGVMKMRPVEGGIEIRPGATVELKPGGYHLMFLDLTAAIREGDSVRGTLTFEKAGTLDVTFAVAPVGAPGPASGHSHH